MRRARITITLNGELLKKIDRLIDGEKIRNRSHAIEFVISRNLEPTLSKAVILAGGHGTKLRPFTYEVPKALLPINGKPLLEHLIVSLKKAGIDEIVLCTGYLGRKIREYFGTGQKMGVHISYSEEKGSLGTGGAVLKAKKYLEDQPFLLIHGDIVTTLSFSDLISFHIKEGGLITAVLTTLSKPSEFGQLTLHGVKLVTFYQKSQSPIKSHLVNCGIYVLEPTVFEYFPKSKKSFYFEDILEKCIKEKLVNGFVTNEKWFDVENPENYEKAIKEFRR